MPNTTFPRDTSNSSVYRTESTAFWCKSGQALRIIPKAKSPTSDTAFSAQLACNGSTQLASSYPRVPLKSRAPSRSSLPTAAPFRFAAAATAQSEVHPTSTTASWSACGISAISHSVMMGSPPQSAQETLGPRCTRRSSPRDAWWLAGASGP